MAKIKIPLEDFKPDARLIDERGPTPEFLKRQPKFIDERGERMRDSPINLAASRKQITDTQYSAGQKFYNHWFRSGMLENFGSVDLNRIFGTATPGCGMPKTEAQAFHRQRIRKAIMVLTARQFWILDHAILRELPITDAGHELGWRNRPQAFAVAIMLFRDALDRLAEEWGIS